MKRTRRVFDPKEKITAVLSIWTQQKNMTQICREMSISWSLLDQWQNQAMEGMLTSLSPKRPDPSKGLNPRLVQLIDKKLSKSNLVKLEKRLQTIQQKAN
jgi:transposase-like protein